MGDLWAFLLQTLTASGAAVLLLVIKAMFRDKLSPRWQFAVWGILGIVLLLPAGIAGRYCLVNWPLLVETAKTLLTGAYTLTEVWLPFPVLPETLPHTWDEWLFVFYELGVLVLACRYVISYVRLRAVLRKGTLVQGPAEERVRNAASQYGLPVCRTVLAEGAATAFLCGIIRPVLILPAGKEVDEKVLVHELLHLKYRDTIWGVVICVLRCIHWCNPLLWYCGGLAGNDLESLCDYHVLTRLEGEERREYGRILLSMTDEKYARMPGTSSLANGGKNISRRIEAIVRFRKYPAGMALVSVCIAAVFGISVLVGAGQEVYEGNLEEQGSAGRAYAFASARVNRCSTLAGALDTYGKSLLTGSSVYRALCAPLDQQEQIAGEGERAAGRVDAAEEAEITETGGSAAIVVEGKEAMADPAQGYYLYNIEETEEGVYSVQMVIPLAGAPAGTAADEECFYFASCQVLAREEEGRWIVVPQGEFMLRETDSSDLRSGCRDLPSYVYADTQAGIRAEVEYQQVYEIDQQVSGENSPNWFWGNENSFDLLPKPNARFSAVWGMAHVRCTYVGAGAEKDQIHELGISAAPASSLDSRPELTDLPAGGNGGGSSSDGSFWSAVSLEEGWGPSVELGGAGGGDSYDLRRSRLPAYYAAQLYINGVPAAEMTLVREEGAE